MAAKPRIGILTGGGDVPGLNSVIKGVVAEAEPLGYEVVGIRRGWMGLTHSRPGEDSISSDLTYDLRSGEADMLDQMVSLTYASLAIDLIRRGKRGCMTAVRGGRYACVPLPQGPSRRVEAARLYDPEHFCPNYRNKLGLPLLLDEVADPA